MSKIIGPFFFNKKIILLNFRVVYCLVLQKLTLKFNKIIFCVCIFLYPLDPFFILKNTDTKNVINKTVRKIEYQMTSSTFNQTEKKWQEFLELNAINSMIDLIKYPVITEKTYLALYKNRQYTFDVDKRLTKSQIKKLFENLFKINVISVNTHIPPRKKIRVGMTQGYRPSYKRVIITVKEGQSINYNLNN